MSASKSPPIVIVKKVSLHALCRFSIQFISRLSSWGLIVIQSHPWQCQSSPCEQWAVGMESGKGHGTRLSPSMLNGLVNNKSLPNYEMAKTNEISATRFLMSILPIPLTRCLCPTNDNICICRVPWSLHNTWIWKFVLHMLFLLLTGVQGGKRCSCMCLSERLCMSVILDLTTCSSVPIWCLYIDLIHSASWWRLFASLNQTN